jgi:hypothetical protein
VRNTACSTIKRYRAGTSFGRDACVGGRRHGAPGRGAACGYRLVCAGRRTEAAKPRSAPPSNNIDAGSCGAAAVLLLMPNAVTTDQPTIVAVATAHTNLLTTREIG